MKIATIRLVKNQISFVARFFFFTHSLPFWIINAAWSSDMSTDSSLFIDAFFTEKILVKFLDRDGRSTGLSKSEKRGGMENRLALDLASPDKQFTYQLLSLRSSWSSTPCFCVPKRLSSCTELLLSSSPESRTISKGILRCNTSETL